MPRRFYLLLFTLILCVGNVYGQIEKPKLITASFDSADIEGFFQKIESITPYFFYYNPAQLDTIKITLSVKEQSLSQVLKLAFRNTNMQFSIDDANHVFITRKFKIATQLPPDYFEKPAITKTELSTDTMLVEIDNTQRRIKKTIENKLYEIGTKTNTLRQGNTTISGHIRNGKTGEPVIHASIIVDKPRMSITTDQFGFYSITIPAGLYGLTVQGLGMKDTRLRLMIYSSGKLDIEMEERVVALKEVIVSAVKQSNISRVQMGVERLDIKTIKLIPAAFGEADILKAVLTLPGVKTVGEASSGFNVRGGATDQNLILFNDATIYNPNHFFGMFSAFNPDVVKSVELYKSGIPAKYGGRLSSVLDIASKEGNKKEFAGVAGIGLLTSRVNIEGPIIKDKTSFIVGGRTTYSNWLIGLLPKAYRKSKASFHDVNLHLSHRFSTKSDLFITGYLSNDRFNLNSDTTYGYSNKNISLKWKYILSNKLTGTITTGYDGYEYRVTSEQHRISAYKLSFDINQLYFKTDFNYYLNSKHTIDFGIGTLKYKLHPGSYTPKGKESLIVPDIVSTEQAMESAAYISDRYNINTNLSVHVGFRYSLYHFLGPKEVGIYAPGLPKEETNRIEIKKYNKGNVIQKYGGPEYRLALRYAFSNSFSVKAGYNSLRQYIHMVSNTTSIAPTDIWKLSDNNIKPQHGEQYSVGLYKNLKENSIETSVEVYYKKIKDYLDYKPGAKLILNHHLETEVINTNGKAYGIELMVKKQNGKLNGWISYTYARILLKADDPARGNIINGGKYYPANYDKPHDVTCVGNYKINHRFSISMNITYSTGRPITLPIARYYYSGGSRVLYSDRNTYRIPDYFRTDFSMNIEGNHKVKQKTHNSWTVGLYNLSGRKNAFSVYYITEGVNINSYKLSIFGSVIPFVNYNIRF